MALYDEFYDFYKNDQNLSAVRSRMKAFNESTSLSSGGSACVINQYGGAWFWFTVMTTIGYGNQAPETKGGQAMVYTLGFLSILLFGGVLAAAGYVSSAIADDTMHRIHLHKLVRPWLACLFWASLYYGWMCIIALVRTLPLSHS